ncbi:hypothetical protein FEZ63_19615 [Microvirga brassicacearum]|uniref:Uncharacterized protein n=2 Tax=Microvirga brassicacearum TaxID=2580413 RepID=A0A5N3P664_9HYPH|nr:hypothetical protein FEZ63_19615 [Microvirga brassicacearum]
MSIIQGPEKEESRRHRARIRELFMRAWDPIGVNGVPEAQDEYDGYVGKAYVMLMHEKASANDLTRYLLWAEFDHMGFGGRGDLTAREARCRRVAEMLVAMRDASFGEDA